MNVTVHALGSIATAAALSVGPADRRIRAPRLLAGFAIGILIHGLLDLLPHSYPVPSRLDVLVGPALIFLALYVALPRNRILILACFAGAIFPDVIDPGPAIANKHLGLPVPQLPLKIFPWHWPQFSGSIYDGTYRTASLICHLIVVGMSFAIVCAMRKKFLWIGAEGRK